MPTWANLANSAGRRALLISGLGSARWRRKPISVHIETLVAVKSTIKIVTYRQPAEEDRAEGGTSTPLASTKCQRNRGSRSHLTSFKSPRVRVSRLSLPERRPLGKVNSTSWYCICVGHVHNGIRHDVRGKVASCAARYLPDESGRRVRPRTWVALQQGPRVMSRQVQVSTG